MPKVPLDGTGQVIDPKKQPNPEFMKKDPMAEFFGPGSGMRLIKEHDDDQIPDEVRAVLEEFGLAEKDFKCTLHEVPAGSDLNNRNQSSANTSYLKGWVRSIPSIDWIAKQYGPGMYLLILSWRMRSDEEDEEGRKSKSMREEIPIQISEKLSEEFRRSRIDAKIKSATEVGTKVQDALIEKKIEGEMITALTGGKGANDKPAAEVAQDYIKQTLETVKMLGIPIGMQQPQKTIEWDKILPVAITAVTAFLSHQREVERSKEDSFNKMLMLMLGQNNSANSQLVEVLKASSGQGSGNTMIKEFTDMIKGAINMRELISPPQETLADKIFKVIEGVAPQILTIAASAAQAKAMQSNPVVKAAQGYMESNPDFRALKADPAQKAELVKKLDDYFGWKQTDVILAVAGNGWDRPNEVPREGVGEPPALEEENGMASPSGEGEVD